MIQLCPVARALFDVARCLRLVVVVRDRVENKVLSDGVEIAGLH